jgi:hypothetical protein
MNEQTAVEWLVEQVNSDCLNSTFIRPELIRKAKAMEREQIEGAFNSGTNFDAYRPNCPAGSTYYETMYEKRKTMIADLKDFFSFSKYKKKK